MNNKAGNFLGEGIDSRGDGGYVIFCGSNTVAGSYESLPGCDPFNTQILDLPPDILQQLSKKTLQKSIWKGISMLVSAMTASLNLQVNWFHQAYMGVNLNMLIEYNNSHCSPPLDKEEIETICQSASKRNQKQTLPFTDLGNSERFIKTANGEIFYCPENGSWLGSVDGTFQPSETIPMKMPKPLSAK